MLLKHRTQIFTVNWKTIPHLTDENANFYNGTLCMYVCVRQEFREQFQDTYKFENHQHLNGTLSMDEITQRKCHYKQYMDPEQRYVRGMEQLMTNDKI